LGHRGHQRTPHSDWRANGHGNFTEPNSYVGLPRPRFRRGHRRRPPVTIGYTGRKTATDKTRKWSPWTIAANSAALLERIDGTAQVAVGNGAGTGKIYKLSDTQLSDDGAAIPSYYTTHYFPERAVEQALALGAHRKLFSYLTLYVEGAGNLGLTSFVDTPNSPQAQQPLPMSSPHRETSSCNKHSRRACGVSGKHQSGRRLFRLQKFIPSVRPIPGARMNAGAAKTSRQRRNESAYMSYRRIPCSKALDRGEGFLQNLRPIPLQRCANLLRK